MDITITTLLEPRLYIVIKNSLVAMPVKMLHSWYFIDVNPSFSIKSLQTKGIIDVKLGRVNEKDLFDWYKMRIT